MEDVSRFAKPKMSSADLVRMMRDEKGIRFNIMSESEAETYLLERNNYFRTSTYRKNYPKHTEGSLKGKYIHLEFAYLVELSTLDMYLREILFQMTVDVEHALKTALISDIEKNEAEDGYQIVDGFLKSHPKVLSSIAHMSGLSGSPFSGELVDKYFVVEKYQGGLKVAAYDCPVWVLTELLSFGDFLRFHSFYSNTYGNE